MIQRLVILISLIFLCPLSADEGSDLEFERFNFVFENDAFLRIDRWYSSGIDLSFLFKVKGPLFHLPFVDRTDSITYLSFALSQEMYTPEEFNNPYPQFDDRPYAGWLYASFAVHQSTTESLDSLELQLGVVGPSAKAEEVQRFIHDNILGDPVNGWQNQLHDEAGINLAYHHHERYRLTTHRYESLFIPRIGGVLGNVRTEFDIGALYRVGVNLPQDFGQNFVMMPGLDSAVPAVNRGETKQSPPFSYYLQLQSDLRLIARDIFLQGSSDGNSLSVEPYPLVGRVGGGVGGSYEEYQLSIIYTAESKSFTLQSAIHGYASLLFTYSY